MTAFPNMDGLRIQETPDTWWAAAISSMSGSDFDVYLFDESTGPENGFETPLISSRLGGGKTDVVLGDNVSAGHTTSASSVLVAMAIVLPITN